MTSLYDMCPNQFIVQNLMAKRNTKIKRQEFKRKPKTKKTNDIEIKFTIRKDGYKLQRMCVNFVNTTKPSFDMSMAFFAIQEN